MSTNSRPMFESLEGRALMSASLVHGVLTVDNSNAGQTIDVIYRPDADPSRSIVEVREGGALTTWRWARDVIKVVVNGNGGDDTIRLQSLFCHAEVDGGTGSDRIYGTERADQLAGGAGNYVDYIYGNGGGDYIYGGRGGDYLNGGEGDDRIYGEDGDDTVYGLGGHDHLYGEGGADRLFGGTGDDLIEGGAGVDRMYGEAGNDFIKARDFTGGEIVNGGTGAIDVAQIDAITGIDFVSCVDVVLF